MINSTNNNDEYFILNGKLLPINMFDKQFVEGEKIIYEVIRVKNSVPIFFSEHIQRLERSIYSANLAPLDLIKLKESVTLLLYSNPVNEKNIKIVSCYRTINEIPSFAIYFIPSNYPSNKEKQNGIKVSTIQATRANPDVKAENKTLRSYADLVIAKTSSYEVLMLNELNQITEGSRSNVFFIKKGNLITAPINLVLGGITREKVLQICSKLGIEVIPNCLSIDELLEIEGGFISGTSPGVLAINQIDHLKLNSNNNTLIFRISNEYEILVNAEIQNWKTY